MSQYDADAAGGEPSPASSSMTPTEALARVRQDVMRLARFEHKSGPIVSDVVWLNDVLVLLDNIEQASVRPADPAEAVEVCPACGGEGQRADGSLCSGCQGFGSIEQSPEAADEAAEAAYQDSQNTDPQYREQRAYERGVVDEARRHPDQHPSAILAEPSE